MKRKSKRSQADDTQLLFMVVIMMIIMILMPGCASFTAPSSGTLDSVLNTDPSQTPYYALVTDVQTKAHNYRYTGTGVLDVADDYQITVHPTDSIARIVWSTCGQSHPVDKPNTGWLNNAYTFDFKITKGIEDVSSCPLEIAIATSNADGNHSIFEFKDRRPEVNLMSELVCNGDDYSWPGVSICQNAPGTHNKIIFDVPVKVPTVPACAAMTNPSGDQKNFEFIMGAGICTYYFTAEGRASNGKRNLHRLKTIGWTHLPSVQE